VRSKDTTTRFIRNSTHNTSSIDSQDSCPVTINCHATGEDMSLLVTSSTALREDERLIDLIENKAKKSDDDGVKALSHVLNLLSRQVKASHGSSASSVKRKRLDRDGTGQPGATDATDDAGATGQDGAAAEALRRAPRQARMSSPLSSVDSNTSLRQVTPIAIHSSRLFATISPTSGGPCRMRIILEDATLLKVGARIDIVFDKLGDFCERNKENFVDGHEIRRGSLDLVEFSATVTATSSPRIESEKFDAEIMVQACLNGGGITVALLKTTHKILWTDILNSKDILNSTVELWTTADHAFVDRGFHTIIGKSPVLAAARIKQFASEIRGDAMQSQSLLVAGLRRQSEILRAKLVIANRSRFAFLLSRPFRRYA
jgi:hypothetical protein